MANVISPTGTAESTPLTGKNSIATQLAISISRLGAEEIREDRIYESRESESLLACSSCIIQCMHHAS